MKDYTPYDNRPSSPVKPEPYKFEYCTCGHEWMRHESENPEKYKGLWHMLGCHLGLIFDGPCKDCICPCYDKLGEFSDEEMIKLKEEGMIHGTIS